jgi:hypothetical protein
MTVFARSALPDAAVFETQFRDGQILDALASLVAGAAIGAALWLAAAATPAEAACSCACVDGQMRAVCSNAVELAPICPPAICPIAPPAVRPITAPQLPPPGASNCRQAQVMNPWTNRYEWQTVCR